MRNDWRFNVYILFCYYLLAKPSEGLPAGQVEVIPLSAVLPDLHLPGAVTLELLQQNRRLALVIIETNWALQIEYYLS